VLEVIEHATDPRSLMEAAVTLLKKPDGGDPGGMLFVSTINRTAKSFGIAIVGGEYISGKLPIGTHSWNQFLSPAEVNGLVGEFGLDEVDKKGMILRLPLYDMRWYFDDNDLDVNWIGSYSHRT
jgi:2-polyprenyl-6-hydroxyphenyl methylase/3-demethylubiquinone-9 3-methyltransferase